MKLDIWGPWSDPDTDWDRIFRLPRSLTDHDDVRFSPSMDIVRDEGELTIMTELPGIDPDEDVEITIEDDILTIQGEKTEERETKEDDRYLHERRYGSFMRRIPLPDGVSPDKVSAAYDKGVLTVRVTLPEENRAIEPTKVPIDIAH